MKPDIIKSGAIILNPKKELLIVKPKSKDMWIFVGGKPEKKESLTDALIREVKEELNVEVVGTPKKYLQSPIEKAAGNKDGLTVQITAFLTEIDGEPEPSTEIEKIHWLYAEEYASGKYTLGSILQKYAIPKLIDEGLM